MRNVIFAVIAVGLSTSALAEWIKIVASDKSTVYAEPSTIRRVGNTAKMWYTLDYGTPQQLTVNASTMHYLSTRGEDEYDCKGSRKRRLILIGYSKNMGGGDTVATDSSAGQWVPVDPNTVAEKMWKFACGKR